MWSSFFVCLCVCVGVQHVIVFNHWNVFHRWQFYQQVRIKPRTAGWEAQTLPVCYAPHPLKHVATLISIQQLPSYLPISWWQVCTIMFSVSTQNQIIVSVSRTLLNIRKIGRRENKIRKKSPDGFHLSSAASAPTGLFCFVLLVSTSDQSHENNKC